MIDFEIFEEFKTYCKDYKIELGNLILENNDNMFILYKPQSKEEIIFEIRCGNRRVSGSSDDIGELLEYSKDVVAELIITKEKGRYV